MARLQTSGILDLQRRLATSGRIRFGDVKGERRPGRPLEFPRCTSPRRELIEQIAELYGGEVKPWPRDGREPEWQVLCTGPVAVACPRGPEPVDQALEGYKGPVCRVRCNGSTCQIRTRKNRWSAPRPCECATNAGVEPEDLDPRDRDCKPTTRFIVWIVGLQDAGVWLGTTRSANAAAEIEFPLRLMQESGRTGWLATVEERKQIPSESGERETDTLRFRFPRITIPAYADELQALERGPDMAQLPGPARPAELPALPAPPPRASEIAGYGDEGEALEGEVIPEDGSGEATAPEPTAGAVPPVPAAAAEAEPAPASAAEPPAPEQQGLPQDVRDRMAA